MNARFVGRMDAGCMRGVYDGWIMSSGRMDRWMNDGLRGGQIGRVNGMCLDTLRHWQCHMVLCLTNIIMGKTIIQAEQSH